MKKLKKIKELMEQLEKYPNISVACDKIGLSRNTVYRWKKEDTEFKENLEEMVLVGMDSISDLAESKLISALRGGEKWAIKLWLENNKKNYVRPRPKSFFDLLEESNKKVSEIKIEIVEGLKRNNEMNQDVTDIENI